MRGAELFVSGLRLSSACVRCPGRPSCWALARPLRNGLEGVLSGFQRSPVNPDLERRQILVQLFFGGVPCKIRCKHFLNFSLGSPLDIVGCSLCRRFFWRGGCGRLDFFYFFSWRGVQVSPRVALPSHWGLGNMRRGRRHSLVRGGWGLTEPKTGKWWNVPSPKCSQWIFFNMPRRSGQHVTSISSELSI